MLRAESALLAKVGERGGPRERELRFLVLPLRSAADKGGRLADLRVTLVVGGGGGWVGGLGFEERGGGLGFGVWALGGWALNGGGVFYFNWRLHKEEELGKGRRKDGCVPELVWIKKKKNRRGGGLRLHSVGLLPGSIPHLYRET